MKAKLLGVAALAAVMGTSKATAANTNSATINFSFYGIGAADTSQSGAGSFSVATPNSAQVVSSVNSFNYSQLVTGYLCTYNGGIFGTCTSSFSYTKNDLTSFSLSFPNETPTLSLATNGVAGTDPNWVHTPFIVNANANPYETSSVTFDQRSVLGAALSNSVLPSVVQNGNGGQGVKAIFEPNFGLSLDQTITLANTALGTSFTHFNWIQYLGAITYPSYNQLYNLYLSLEGGNASEASKDAEQDLKLIPSQRGIGYDPLLGGNPNPTNSPLAPVWGGLLHCILG